MNLEQLQGQWQQLKGQIRQQWGKLTDDDIALSQGNVEKLIGRLTARYGISKEIARDKLTTFLDEIDQPGSVAHTLSVSADRIINTTARAAKSGREFAQNRPILTTSMLVALGAWVGYRLFRS